MDPDRVVNKRKIYNILDLLGDIGGLNGALSQVCAFILYIFGNNYTLNTYLLRTLFTKPTQQERSFTETSDIKRSKQIV